MTDVSTTIVALVLTTIYLALGFLFQTVRLNRVTSKLEIVYAVASIRGHHTYTELLRDEVKQVLG